MRLVHAAFVASALLLLVVAGIEARRPTSSIPSADLEANSGVRPHVNVKIKNTNNIKMAQTDKRTHTKVLRTNKIEAMKDSAAAVDAGIRAKEAAQQVYEKKLLMAEKKEQASLQESLKKQQAMQQLQQQVKQAHKAAKKRDITTDPNKIRAMMREAVKILTVFGANAEKCKTDARSKAVKGDLSALMNVIQQSIAKAKGEGAKTGGLLEKAEAEVITLYELAKKFNSAMRKCGQAGGLATKRK